MIMAPLTPLNDAEGLDAYIAAMDVAMKDPRVRNISIAAQYGAGKSTFLQTYFRECNVLWVSLASFLHGPYCRGQGVNQKGLGGVAFVDGCDNQWERRLEASILQQMFYAASERELPFSHFTRVASVGIRRYFLVALLLAIPIVAYVLGKWWLYPLAIIPVVMFAMDVYKRVGWELAVKYKGVEMSMEQKADSSVFNRFLDEIIYYFATLKYDAVVFEDIDRCNNIELFVKLREMNQILNNARQIPRDYRPIKFVYAVRDDLLETKEDRVKFFDVIIPIVPVLDPNNAAIIFTKMLKQTQQVRPAALPDCERLIHHLSPFFKDYRLVNNIVNEYSIIRERMKSSALLDNRLLAIVIFKNYFPAEYDAACRREGLLEEVLGDFVKTKTVQDIVNKPFQETVDAIEAQIKSIEDCTPRDINELNRKYFIDGFLHMIPHNADSLILDGQNVRYMYQKYMSPDIIPLLVGHRGVFMSQGTYRVSVFSWDSVEQAIGGQSRYDEIKAKIEDRNNRKLEDLKCQLAKAKVKLDEVKNMAISHVVASGSLDVNTFKTLLVNHKIECENSALLYALLAEGAIAEDYPNYLSQYSGTEDGQADFEYRVTVMNGVGDGTAFDVKRPEEVIDALPEPYFHNDVILNHSIFKYFVESGGILSGSNAKASAFAKVVCESKDGLAFLAEHLKKEVNEQYKFCVLEALMFQQSELDEEVARIMSEDRRHGDIILGVWIRRTSVNNAGNVKLSDKVRTYFIESTDVKQMFDTMGLSIGDVKLLLLCNRVPFKYVDVSTLDKELANEIVTTNSYTINSITLKGILTFLGVDSDSFEKKNLSAVKNCGNDNVVKYVCDEQNFVCSYLPEVYARLLKPQEEPSDTICYILNEPFMTRTACRTFISKQSSKIVKSASIINQNAYEVAFLDDKVIPSWENALELFVRCCMSKEDRDGDSEKWYDLEALKMLSGFISRNWQELQNEAIPIDLHLADFKRCVSSGSLDLYPDSLNKKLTEMLQIGDVGASTSSLIDQASGNV